MSSLAAARSQVLRFVRSQAAALTAAIASGALLGLTCLPHMSAALAPLAWFWIVPLLLWVGPAAPARKLLSYAWIAGLVGSLVLNYGMIPALGSLAIVYYPIAGLVLALPFAPFLLMRRIAGATIALWSMPLIWPCTEWLVLHVEGLPPYLSMAVTQGNATWMAQYADLFGEWGITSWVVLFNVAMYRSVTGAGSWQRRSARCAMAAIALLAFPLGYSAIRLHPNGPAPWYRVLLLQPNTATGLDSRRVVENETYLTDVAVSKGKPDLIVWPEGAVPYMLERDMAVRKFLSQAVSDWGTPLVTGAVDVQRMRLSLLGAARPRRAMNAAFVMTPGPPRSGAEETRVSLSHAKRRLVPFVEAMPYSRVSWVSRAYKKWGIGDDGWIPGRDFHIADYVDDGGRRVRFATVICWEELYPEDIAELARRGAQFFAVSTSDAVFRGSPITYQHASIARLRAIETRKPFVRSSVNGLTIALDAEGRGIASAQAGQQATVVASIAPADGLTFYVLHPNLWPQICAAGLAVLAAAGFRKLRNNEQ